jgi:hypothetical protein
LSIALYVFACCLPVLEFKNSGNKPNDIMWGYNALAVGWSGIFAGVVPWYANPFGILGLVFAFFRKRLFGVVAGIFSVAIALTTFHYIGQELPADEGGVNHTTIIRVLPGYYIWLASLVMVATGAVLQKSKMRRLHN